MEYFVKKSIISLILLTCILLQVTGCTEIQIFNNEAENQSTSAQNIENKSTGGGNTDSNCTEIEGTESTLQQTQKRIRNIAYQSIDESAKTEIKDQENGEVEEYKALIDHTIRGQSGFVNIKGKTFLIIQNLNKMPSNIVAKTSVKKKFPFAYNVIYDKSNKYITPAMDIRNQLYSYKGNEFTFISDKNW